MKNNNTLLIGVVLIILGGVAFVYDHITIKKEEKDVGFGPFRATEVKREVVPIPPILGGLLIIAGIFIVFRATKK